MTDLSKLESASRLRIYIGESDHWRGEPLYKAILSELKKKDIAGASVFRGMAGFGAGSRISDSSNEFISMDLPIVIETVDKKEKIDSVLDILYPMVKEGMITRDEVQIVKYTQRYLNPLPADKAVSEIMTRDVLCFTPDTLLSEAWEAMVNQQIKAIPIVDNTKKVLGVLTDEDLLERGGIGERLSIAVRLDPELIKSRLETLQQSDRKIGEIMTAPAITVSHSDPLSIATTLMVHNDLTRLPVVDAEGCLVGVISRLDVLRLAAQNHQQILEAKIAVPMGGARTIKEVMTTNLPLVNHDETLPEIIEKFSKFNSTRLIVVDDEGKAIGLISDSDVVARIQPEKQNGILQALRRLGQTPPSQMTASNLMSPGVLTTFPETSVLEATKLMIDQSRKWLVVVDVNGLPVGLVDRKILLESLAGVFPK